MLDYLKKYKKDIIGFFDEILHPSTNGIKVLCFDEDFKIGDYKNNEIWTESNCLFFKEAVLVDLKRKLPKK